MSMGGGFSSDGDDAKSTVPEVRAIVKEHDLVVFSSPTCGYCSKAIAELERSGFRPFIVNAERVRSELRQLTMSSTLPSVWVRGRYVGGCMDGPLPWHGVFPLLQSGRFYEMMRGPRA